MKTTAILLAGGSGSRMKGAVDDKILHPIAGKPVWRHSYEAFLESGCIQNIIFVCRDPDQQAAIKQRLSSGASPVTETPASAESAESPNTHYTQGGAKRQDSVWTGLKASPPDTETVLIHDLARPLITPEAIRQVAQAAIQTGVACVARNTSDTIKRCQPNGDGAYLPETIDRSQLWSMETPQAFRFSLIRDAYQRIIESGQAITDDLSAIEHQAHPVAFVEDARPNLKITTQQDLTLVARLLETL